MQTVGRGRQGAQGGAQGKQKWGNSLTKINQRGETGFCQIDPVWPPTPPKKGPKEAHKRDKKGAKVLQK